MRDDRHLYFIYNRFTGLIKIGVAIDVVNRLRTLECNAGVKLDVIGILHQGGFLESELHRAFAEWRECGEWFRPAAHLVYLAKNPSAMYARQVIDDQRYIERATPPADLPQYPPHDCGVDVLNPRSKRRWENFLANRNPKPCLERASESLNPATSELSC